MTIYVLSENPRLSITDGALDYIRKFKSDVERERGDVRIVLYVDSEIFVCNEPAPASAAASEDALQEWLARNASVRRNVPMVGANPPDRFPWLNKVEVEDIEFDLRLETFPANISSVEVDGSNKLILV